MLYGMYDGRIPDPAKSKPFGTMSPVEEAKLQQWEEDYDRAEKNQKIIDKLIGKEVRHFARGHGKVTRCINALAGMLEVRYSDGETVSASIDVVQNHLIQGDERLVKNGGTENEE